MWCRSICGLREHARTYHSSHTAGQLLYSTDNQGCLCTVYWYLFFASRILPGVPSWEAPPEQYKEILNESINFWYCNNAFEAAGWPHIPNEAVRLWLFALSAAPCYACYHFPCTLLFTGLVASVLTVSLVHESTCVLLICKGSHERLTTAEVFSTLVACICRASSACKNWPVHANLLTLVEPIW